MRRRHDAGMTRKRSAISTNTRTPSPPSLTPPLITTAAHAKAVLKTIEQQSSLFSSKFSAQQDNTQHAPRVATTFSVGTLQHDASSTPPPVFQVDAVVNDVSSRCLVLSCAAVSILPRSYVQSPLPL